jgi:hypothetical protein
VLAERLRWLTETGVLDQREYSRRPPRHEYLLTVKGLELFEVLMVMVRWGDKWLAGLPGPPVLYRHHACGQISHVELRCSECGRPMRATDIDVLPGPGAAAPASHQASWPLSDRGPDVFRAFRAKMNLRDQSERCQSGPGAAGVGNW